MKFAILDDDDDGYDAPPWAARAPHKPEVKDAALCPPARARFRAPSDDEDDESTASSDQDDDRQDASSEEDEDDEDVAAHLAMLRVVGKTRQGTYQL